MPWSLGGSYNQVAGGLRDVYFQILTPAGPVGSETRANVTTAYNQRSTAIAPAQRRALCNRLGLEQQRFENSVDVYARIFNANGVAATGEFLINSGRMCAPIPSVAPAADGGFAVAWRRRASKLPTLGIFTRGHFRGPMERTTRLVNT